MDDRAQAIGIGRLFLSLGAGAIVFFIVGAVTAPLFEMANEHGSGQVATNGTTWLQQAVDYIPIAVLFVSFFGLVAYAVFTRGILR